MPALGTLKGECCLCQINVKTGVKTISEYSRTDFTNVDGRGDMNIACVLCCRHIAQQVQKRIK